MELNNIFVSESVTQATIYVMHDRNAYYADQIVMAKKNEQLVLQPKTRRILKN